MLVFTVTPGMCSAERGGVTIPPGMCSAELGGLTVTHGMSSVQLWMIYCHTRYVICTA